jgi:hypothetical protein
MSVGPHSIAGTAAEEGQHKAAAWPAGSLESSAASDDGSSSSDSSSDASAASAAELLQQLLSGASTGATSPDAFAAGDNTTSGSTSSPADGLLPVLTQLQHLEEWAYSQVSGVVLEELSQVLSALNPDGFAQREAAVQAVLEKWVQGCDELVEARRLGRRNLLTKLMHQVGYWRLVGFTSCKAI